MRTKIEETQEEIFTTSDEHDAQKREEGGDLQTLSPEMVHIDTEIEKMAASSDWSGRGSRSRGSSRMNTSSGSRLDELKSMIQSLTTGVQNSNTLGDAMRNEQEATANASANMVTDIVNMETDLKRVIAKMDTIEEEVGATKKILEKTNSRVEKLRRRSRKMRRKSNRWRKKLQR